MRRATAHHHEHKTNERRGPARSLAFALGLLAAPAMLAAVTLTPNVAHADAKTASCRVNAVLARKVDDGQRIPKDLAFMAKELESDEFAAYKSFKLLDAEDYQLSVGKKLERGLKSGHRVGLVLLGGDEKRPKFNITIQKPGSKKPLLSTDYGIRNNGIMIVGGLKHEDGRLLFAIQCRSK